MAKVKRQPDCSLPGLINVLSSKWVLFVLPVLRDGPKRNAALLRSIEGISQRMLTQTLRHLEKYSLVERRDFGEVPPKVEYALTALGESLAKRLETLDEWLRENHGST